MKSQNPFPFDPSYDADDVNGELWPTDQPLELVYKEPSELSSSREPVLTLAQQPSIYGSASAPSGKSAVKNPAIEHMESFGLL